MSVARVTEISATNPDSFEAAINEAITRATSTLRNVEGAWVKDMNVMISDNNIVGYKVNLAVTFVNEAQAPRQYRRGFCFGAPRWSLIRGVTVRQPVERYGGCPGLIV